MTYLTLTAAAHRGQKTKSNVTVLPIWYHYPPPLPITHPRCKISNQGYQFPSNIVWFHYQIHPSHAITPTLKHQHPLAFEATNECNPHSKL
ncbi:hypothetical protein EYC84_004841 [Monilinia fructicola]|uniref:Uncharacterized protein n=1 Tax=Monilinia fructicola TaxID=38448 RepID=A0A5M9K6Q7_MONFR|nr:hypothetical protein EYC84_004841 [Monilinia fructicola]